MTPLASRRKRKPVELFVSYSHSDGIWLERLRPVLKFNHCRDRIFAWNDQEMKAGDRWDREIRAALERMDVFVPLVSFELLASDYVKTVELRRALARGRKNKIEIVPVLLFPMDLRRECPQLSEFNPLPGWGECWMAYEQKTGYYQAAHKPIREGLREAIEKMMNSRP